jgi:hypothetical protein
LVLFSTAVSLPSCDIINPTEKIPAYLHIDSFVLKGSYDSVGSLSKAITDVWVLSDNEFIGAFELPATVPILMEGNHKILFRAGIKENGISNTRLYYPFYAKYEAVHNLIPKATITINPTIYYLESDYKMPLHEDFEGQVTEFTKSNVSNIDLETTNQNGYVFEGQSSLFAVMKNKNDIFQIESTKIYQLPRGAAIFMEINYKSSIALKLGYYASSAAKTYQHLVLTLNPTTTWKKIYVNYGTEIDFEPLEYMFKFFIGALKNSGNDSSVVQLDNIKILYLE